MLGACKDPPVSSEARSNYLALSNVHPWSWMRENRLLKQYPVPILRARVCVLSLDWEIAFTATLPPSRI